MSTAAARSRGPGAGPGPDPDCSAARASARESARAAVARPVLPPGPGDRVGGYGVMGLPFAGGDYLALRHFTASSFGPGYRAVWHRDPEGRWTVYADAAPAESCARFLGPALTAARTAPVGIEWTGPLSATVTVDGVLTWRFELASDAATALMSAVGSRLPARACHVASLLRPMGFVAGSVLSAGKVRLRGTLPAGQRFGALPRRVWRIAHASAQVQGRDLGATGPLERQSRLGGFLLPQRGLFFSDAAAVFTPAR